MAAIACRRRRRIPFSGGIHNICIGFDARLSASGRELHANSAVGTPICA